MSLQAGKLLKHSSSHSKQRISTLWDVSIRKGIYIVSNCFICGRGRKRLQFALLYSFTSEMIDWPHQQREKELKLNTQLEDHKGKSVAADLRQLARFDKSLIIYCTVMQESM